MARLIFIVLFLLTGFTVHAQDAISGYLPVDTREGWEQKVYLAKIKLEDFPDFNKAKPIAVSPIDQEGYFSFKKDLIADKEAIYRVYVKRIEKILKDTLQTDELFLLSNADSIRFIKNKPLFANYTNTNAADKEWKKLQNFEASLNEFDFQDDKAPSDAYVQQVKRYAKDSLQILMVKLIGIKQLDDKKLLDQDIAKNPDYYRALLQELRESELDRSAYLFLENKLAFLTTEAAERKFQLSRALNVLMGLVIAGFLVLVFRFRRKKKELAMVPLSKQERNIRDLILAGKSNKDIANELYISLNTVKTHITNIYNKLQVDSRQELLQRDQN